MDIKIEDSWKNILQEEFNKAYFEELISFVKNEYRTTTCYPKGKDIFAAFDHCSFEDTKVVILGQDPYHGAGQANGLCFSVHDGISHPPSLINIFKEIETDLLKIKQFNIFKNNIFANLTNETKEKKSKKRSRFIAFD